MWEKQGYIYHKKSGRQAWPSLHSRLLPDEAIHAISQDLAAGREEVAVAFDLPEVPVEGHALAAEGFFALGLHDFFEVGPRLLGADAAVGLPRNEGMLAISWISPVSYFPLSSDFMAFGLSEKFIIAPSSSAQIWLPLKRRAVFLFHMIPILQQRLKVTFASSAEVQQSTPTWPFEDGQTKRRLIQNLPVRRKVTHAVSWYP